MAYCDKSCVHDTFNMLPLERMMRNMAVAPRRCALSTHTVQAMPHTRLEVETLTRESIIRSIVSVLTALIVMMYQSGWSECGPQSRTE